jgi:hypothetical protein
MEWFRRYLPSEIAGWAGELGSAAAVYHLTGSFAAAVVAGTLGSSIGYYGTAYVNNVRWCHRAQAGRHPVNRILVANGLAARSIAVEFGPAEAIDTILIRPAMLFLGPAVVGNVAAGWIVGSLVADAAFYVLAIVSYERFRTLVARRHPPTKITTEEVGGGPVETIAPA